MSVERLDDDALALDDRDYIQPPHSRQAEEAVLGSILKHPPSLMRVSDFLAAEDFYDQRHKSIYRAITALQDEGTAIDYHTLTDRLTQLGLYESAGGLLYLSEINLATPSAAYVEHYGRIVERTSVMRKLISSAQSIAEIAYKDNLDPETAVAKAEQLIAKITANRQTRDFQHIETLLTAYMDQVASLQEGEGMKYGVPSGYMDLDKLLGGFQRTDLIILAARTSIGKTALAMNIAVNAAVKYRAAVAIYSLEMSGDQLAARLLAMESGVDAPRIRTAHLNEQETRKLDMAMNHLALAPIWVDDTPALGLAELRNKARRLAAQQQVDFLVVDYLQLITGAGGEKRVDEIATITRGLKALARELNVPILALSQLSRAVEQRAGHIPQLSDLRESGCLTADTTLLRADNGLPIALRDLLANGGKGVCLWSMDDRRRLTPMPVTNVFCSGTKPVFRLRLASGREVKASGNHAFLAFSGWRALDGLAVGDHLAIPRRTPEPLQAGLGWSEHRLGLLAHLIGDGCVLPRQSVHYTSDDEDNLAFVEAAARAEFGIKSKRVPQGSWSHVYLPAPFHLTHGRRNPIVQWFHELGIDGLRAGLKRLPDVLYGASRREIAVFLRHLWATDGHVAEPSSRTHRSSGSLVYGTNSRVLADGVAILLSRFGIIGRIKRAHKGGWLLYVNGGENLRIFAREIGVHGRRGARMERLIAEIQGRTTNANVGALPSEAWQLVRSERQRVGVTERQFQAALGMQYCGSTLYKTGISRERMLRCAEILDSEALRCAASDDVFWDRIVAIESLGSEPVFDATVGGTHSFIANGIVAHNSQEQDADVVVFIHREEKFDPDTDKKGVADIIVAKHRNGPTGQVQLLFLERTTKFLDLEVYRS